MNLRITNCNNFFKIKGSLNRETLAVFQAEFEHVFERFSSFTISIEDVEAMDRFGVEALAALHNEAVTKNKAMAIIGLGSKDLYDHFKSQIAA